MRLPKEFIQLPVSFDVEKMSAEVDAFPQQQWVPHHEGFAGNFSIPLVSVRGEDNNAFKGPMAVTRHLEQCPYIKQVIASFGEVIGRSRLMGLAPGCEVPLHSDINYHWYKRVRIHVPIITDPAVTFYCGDKTLHMEAGDAWIFDSWKYHKVVNNSDIFRVHLVIDIAGSHKFWQMVDRVTNTEGKTDNAGVAPKRIDFNAASKPVILTEKINVPLVMSPGEMDGLVNDMFHFLESDESHKKEEQFFRTQVLGLAHDWRILWSQFGTREEGWKHYHQLRVSVFESVKHLDSILKLNNGTQATRMFLHCIIDPALNPEVKGLQ